jgi:hypothetical protein
VFHHKNIRLSIGDNFTSGKWPQLPISSPENLLSLITRFTSGDGEVNTSYLYYKNDYCILRDIEPSGIVGIGRNPSAKNRFPLHAALPFSHKRRVIFHGRESLWYLQALTEKWSDNYKELQPDPDSTLKPAKYCARCEV